MSEVIGKRLVETGCTTAGISQARTKGRAAILQRVSHEGHGGHRLQARRFVANILVFRGQQEGCEPVVLALRLFRYVVWMALAWLGGAFAQTGNQPTLEDLLEMRVISAARRLQTPAEAPSMVSVITASEIHRFGWKSLGEALASIRGLNVSYDRSYSYLGVRGFGRPGDYTSRVLLMVDGHPINDGVYDQAPVGPEFPVDMELVDRIEFVPGAGSVMYGGNALLGVINVVTKTGASNGRQVRALLGDGGATRASVSAGWRDSGGRDGLLSYSRERNRGRDLYFESYEAIGANAWSRGLDQERNERFFGQVRQGGFAAALIANQRTKGVPGGAYGIDLNAPGSQVRDRRWQVNLHFEQPLSASTALQVRGQAMDVRYNGDWMYSGVSQPDGMATKSVGGEVSITSTAIPGHTWLAGLSLRRDGERHQFAASLDADTPRRFIGLFAQDDLAFGDHVILSAGLRHDALYGVRDYHHLSPRLALIVKPAASTVIKAISGAAFRPPNAYETDYAFTGTNAANPNLRSERVLTNELGVVQDLGGDSSLSGSIYRTRLLDLISIERDSATNIQQHHNVGRVDAHGLEFEARTRIGPVGLRGGVSLQRVRHESGAEVANTPKQLAKLLLDAPIPAGIRLGWETYYLGARTTDSGAVGTTGERVGGSSVSHATLTGDLARDLEWQLKMTNVFDRIYGNVVGTEFSNNFPGVQQSPMMQMPQDRRGMSLRLRWTY